MTTLRTHVVEKYTAGGSVLDRGRRGAAEDGGRSASARPAGLLASRCLLFVACMWAAKEQELITLVVVH